MSDDIDLGREDVPFGAPLAQSSATDGVAASNRRCGVTMGSNRGAPPMLMSRVAVAALALWTFSACSCNPSSPGRDSGPGCDPASCPAGQVCGLLGCRDCRQDTECGAGGRCCGRRDGGSAACVAGDCCGSTDCSAGESCLDNSCKACASDAQCPGGKCCNNRCRPAATCCPGDTSCPGQSCILSQCRA